MNNLLQFMHYIILLNIYQFESSSRKNAQRRWASSVKWPDFAAYPKVPWVIRHNPGHLRKKERRRKQWWTLIGSEVIQRFSLSFCDYIITEKTHKMNKQSGIIHAQYSLKTHRDTNKAWEAMSFPCFQVKRQRSPKAPRSVNREAFRVKKEVTMKHIGRNRRHAALAAFFVWSNHTRKSREMEWTNFSSICTKSSI